MNPFTPKRLDDFDDGDKMCPVLADPLPECYCSSADRRTCLNWLSETSGVVF